MPIAFFKITMHGNCNPQPSTTAVFLSGTFDTVGDYVVTVTASDGEFSTSSIFTVAVTTPNALTNTPPVSASIVVPPVVVGTELSIPVAQYFDDIDGDTLMFSTTPLPGTFTLYTVAPPFEDAYSE
jgi:hypothetical protein